MLQLQLDSIMTQRLVQFFYSHCKFLFRGQLFRNVLTFQSLCSSLFQKFAYLNNLFCSGFLTLISAQTDELKRPWNQIGNSIIDETDLHQGFDIK